MSTRTLSIGSSARLGSRPRGIARGPRPLAVAGGVLSKSPHRSISLRSRPLSAWGNFLSRHGIGPELFNAVGRFGNGGRLDDAGGSFERVGLPEHAADDVLAHALQRKDPLRQLLEQLAGLDAEVGVGVLSHRSGRLN